MSDGATCSVWSDFEIRLEVGLVRGIDREHKNCLAPGPEHRTFELHRGINHGVPRALVVEWMKRNRKYLDCIKDGRIRIVEQKADAEAA